MGRVSDKLLPVLHTHVCMHLCTHTHAHTPKPAFQTVWSGTYLARWVSQVPPFSHSQGPLPPDPVLLSSPQELVCTSEQPWSTLSFLVFISQRKSLQLSSLSAPDSMCSRQAGARGFSCPVSLEGLTQANLCGLLSPLRSLRVLAARPGKGPAVSGEPTKV